LWQGNSLYVSGKERIAMSVPQDFYTGIKSFYALLENEKKSEARVVEDTSQEQTDKDGKVVPETRSLAERIAYQMFK
ncbi:hypothetical protein, partial [Vibrio cholerae]|uniref:hypothetical protein n=1 Tax=Vibrio cholerae TaxID=666 RepID=UPI00301B77B8